VTNEITASKAELALDLQNAGLEVLDYVPERIVPPIVIVTAGSTYLAPETVGHEYRLSLTLTMVAATATNEEATEALDALIAQTVSAIATLGYAVLRQVNASYRLAANNAEYLASDLNLDLSITL
jgi:ribosomal protein S7